MYIAIVSILIILIISGAIFLYSVNPKVKESLKIPDSSVDGYNVEKRQYRVIIRSVGWPDVPEAPCPSHNIFLSSESKVILQVYSPLTLEFENINTYKAKRGLNVLTVDAESGILHALNWDTHKDSDSTIPKQLEKLPSPANGIIIYLMHDDGFKKLNQTFKDFVSPSLPNIASGRYRSPYIGVLNTSGLVLCDEVGPSDCGARIEKMLTF